MEGRRRVHAAGRVSLLLGALVMALLLAALAYADDISNTLDASIDGSFEFMALNVGGETGSTTFIVTPRNGDGKNGCNLTGSTTTLVVSVASSNPGVATVSPSSLTFGACGDVKAISVTPVATGTASVTVSQTSNNTGGTFNLAPAGFTVDVAPPPNTAPVVQVTGVTHGGSYDHGSVPTAGCLVSDAEDGLTNSTSAATATLSPFTGPYAADGIGSQTAQCSYTDGGGLTQTVQATYTVTDPSTPVITPSPVGTTGLNDWYTSDVTLTWLVQEPQSPSSLTKTGCDPQSITSDVAGVTFKCEASSAGGASEVSVVIKRDASAPTVTGAPATAPNGAGWYKAAVTLNWTCADVGPSGLLDSCPATTVLGNEGREQTGQVGPIRDNAGNTSTGTSTPTVNIDMTSPAVSAATAATPVNVSGTDWYKDSVTFQWTADDPVLGDGSAGSGAGVVSPPSSTFNTTGTGHSASAAATDQAGNTGTGYLSGVNVDASNPSVGLVCPTTVLLGGTATASWTASDTGSGLATAASGSVALETDTVGAKTATAPTASDNVGHTSAPVSCQYRVVYGFAGLFAPIDRPNTMNVSKAGQSIPLKWRLTDAHGNPVLNLNTATVAVTGIPCSLGASDDLVEEAAPGGSGLQNLGDGYYQINWKTPTSYAGSCKSLNLSLGEGAPRTALAYISFKK